jgi:hypothetical protein
MPTAQQAAKILVNNIQLIKRSRRVGTKQKYGLRPYFIIRNK